MMEDRNVPTLVGDLFEKVSTLFRKEIQLAKTELSEKAGKAANASMAAGAGVVVLLAGLIIMMHAAVAWLARAGVPPHWGFLVVACIGLLLGYVLLQRGLSRLKTSSLVPERTVEQLQRDAAVAREQVQ